MTVLSFISKGTYKVSFFRVGEIEMPVKSFKNGKKKKYNKTTGALKLRWGKGRKKVMDIYLSRFLFATRKVSLLREKKKKTKLSWTQPHCGLDGMYRFLRYSFSLAFHLSVFITWNRAVIVLSLLFAQPIRSSTSSSGHFVTCVRLTDLAGQFDSESSFQSRFWPCPSSGVKPRLAWISLAPQNWVTRARGWNLPLYLYIVPGIVSSISCHTVCVLPFCHMSLFWG